MAEHTPGPWKMKPPGTIVAHSDKCVVKHPASFDWVATVQVSNVPQWEANGRLIAAAPDLLAAVEWYLECDECMKWLFGLSTDEYLARPDYMDGDIDRFYGEAKQALQAAVASARGE